MRRETKRFSPILQLKKQVKKVDGFVKDQSNVVYPLFFPTRHSDNTVISMIRHVTVCKEGLFRSSQDLTLFDVDFALKVSFL
jgi:hypothetical protein